MQLKSIYYVVSKSPSLRFIKHSINYMEYNVIFVCALPVRSCSLQSVLKRRILDAGSRFARLLRHTALLLEYLPDALRDALVPREGEPIKTLINIKASGTRASAKVVWLFKYEILIIRTVGSQYKLVTLKSEQSAPSKAQKSTSPAQLGQSENIYEPPRYKSLLILASWDRVGQPLATCF